MGMNAARLRPGSWTCGALQAATIIAVAAACSAPSADQGNASVPPARVAQSTSGDPCRYVSAQDIGKAFGRPMQGSKLVNSCHYKSADGGLVVLTVATRAEGTILHFARLGTAQGRKETEKVATAAGEAYFESSIPAFIGRVGNQEVQIETTIEPAPREALIAIGRRIMEMLDRK